MQEDFDKISLISMKCVHDFVDFKDDSYGICKRRILLNILFIILDIF